MIRAFDGSSRRDGAGPVLPVGAEPLHLRAELRRLIGERSSEARGDLARRLAGREWRVWRAELAGHGLDSKGFLEIVLGHEQEIWLWALGDRSWEQMMAGLCGRVRRRLGD